MLSRRDFLSRSALIALAPTRASVPRSQCPRRRAQRDGRVLVVIELNGGNDGINTVVPFKDEGYAKHRKVLRLPEKRLLKISDRVALHPALGDAVKLLESKRLAIVQGVGYPNPNRSHARSMAIWQTARFDPEEHKGYGWLGRALDADDRPRPRCSSARKRCRPPCAAGVPSPRHCRGWKNFNLMGDPAIRTMASAAPADDLPAFVQRSFLDAYTTCDRLAEVAHVKDGGASYPGTALATSAATGGAFAQVRLRRPRLLHDAGRLRYPRGAAAHATPNCCANWAARCEPSSTIWPRRSWRIA